MRNHLLGTAFVALCLAVLSHAQTTGYIYHGRGTPVRTTYIAAPVPGVAPTLAPNSANGPGTQPIGPCYCTPVVHSLTACFNFRGATTDINCDTPLAYACTLVTAAAGTYTQQAGPVYNCSTSGSGPAGAPPVLAPLPTLPAAINQQSYATTFQANSTSPAPSPTVTQYTSLPMLQTGQLLNINPSPSSMGMHFQGADITDNGHLNGIPLEPPNPAVCAGNGFVLEATNDVLIIYDAQNGTVLGGPTDFQHFFGVQGPPYNGLSDSYCLYDEQDSKRFFVSMSYFSCRTNACFSRGLVPAFSYLLVGVSRTSDPRNGFLGPYYIATDGINPDTNEPYPGFEPCGTAPTNFTGKGCLGDFPNPGMDKNGFWFGMNMFTIDATTLIGANVFGVRKSDLLSGQLSNPSVVTFTDWAPYPGFTIVPSISQAGTQHDPAQGGTVYLMSSDSFSYTGQANDSFGIPSLRSWAITSTSLLEQNFPNGQTPILSPPVTLVTEALAFTSTELANQEAPSGTSVPQPSGPILGAQDERMRQVAYSGGYLYSCLNTPVRIAGRTFNALAYFVLRPSLTAAGVYSAKIVDQGYIANDGSHLLNGAITATANGSAVITGSIVGTGFYLSAFYAHISPKYGAGPIHVPKISTNPLLNEGPGQLPQRRTGDYSSATLDEQGKVWIVAEWASDRYITLAQPDTRASRVCNWGTYIMQVDPYILD